MSILSKRTYCRIQLTSFNRATSMVNNKERDDLSYFMYDLPIKIDEEL